MAAGPSAGASRERRSGPPDLPGIMDRVNRKSSGAADRPRRAGEPSPGAGPGGAADRLLIWPPGADGWVSCRSDEITWLDRGLLSGNQDLTLHRPPRCAGLRYVHRQWELFSRDTSYEVYLAPHEDGTPQDHRAVQLAARQVLPVAPAHYETLPVVLEEGAWLVSVGRWVLALKLEAAGRGDRPGAAVVSDQPQTQESRVRRGGAARRGTPPRPEAAADVRGWFDRNETARMAMALHYREYLLGLPAPQPVPMTEVAIALDLSGEGAVSDYKKLLQDLIWAERGHPRELPEFLLASGLLTRADLELARKTAVANERSGKSELTRQRLRYLKKK